jgi:hypothetical protein
MELLKDGQEFLRNLQKRTSLIQQFRTHKQKAKLESIPFLKGQFHLKMSKIRLIDDSKVKDLEMPLLSQLKEIEGSTPFANEFYEIIMFGENFKIVYNHFDAVDLNNLHQIKIVMSSSDMGIKVIKNFISSSEK